MTACCALALAGCRYVPLGVKRWFERRGIKGNVVEMDW
jgi:hypothetical protein